MTDSILATAAQWNNAGVTHFIRGQWSMAIPHFRRSMQVIEANVADDGQAYDDGQGAPALDDPSHWVAAIRVSSSLVASQKQLEEDDDDDVPFYEFPILLQEQRILTGMMAGEVPSMDRYITCSAVATFNMALACHKMGMETKGGVHLTRALRLYEASIQMLSGSAKLTRDYAGIIVVALNNRTILYHKCGRYEDLERDAERLLPPLDAAFQTKITSRILSEEELQGIFLNLLLLRRPAVASAA